MVKVLLMFTKKKGDDKACCDRHQGGNRKSEGEQGDSGNAHPTGVGKEHRQDAYCYQS